TATDHVALPADYVLGQPGIVLGPGQEQPSGNGVAVPQVGTSSPAGAPAMTLALAFTPDGTIIASTYPARYPVGSSAYAVIPTRGIVQRLRRLGLTTATFAGGDFGHRVDPGAADEVGQLERDFNTMAERLQSAVDHERTLAEKSARLAERSRISRELHDSISQ